jgi:chemotaxis signal transduction protein
MSEGRAQHLHDAFDRGFAEPLPERRPDREQLLLIRVGPVGRALRVGELVGVYVDCPVTPVPSPILAFAGLTAVRGALVPVFDLAELLGVGAGSPGATRWMALLGGGPAVAVSFEGLEQHVARLPEEVRRGPGSSPASAPLVLRVGEVAVPILEVADLRARMPDPRRASGVGGIP